MTTRRALLATVSGGLAGGAVATAAGQHDRVIETTDGVVLELTDCQTGAVRGRDRDVGDVRAGVWFRTTRGSLHGGGIVFPGELPLSITPETIAARSDYDIATVALLSIAVRDHDGYTIAHLNAPSEWNCKATVDDAEGDQ